MVSVLPKEGFITAKELASFLGISEPSVKAYVKRNSMHFVVIGKKWLIDLSQFGAGKGGGEGAAPRRPRKKEEPAQGAPAETP
jgi:excisionase family DNA binding protein